MLLWKLLKKNISVAQLLGYSIASFLGMTIVLLAFHFYTDTRPLFSSQESLFKSDFIVISKKVSLLKTIGDGSAFNKSEIENIRKQPFVKELSYFTPCLFKVQAFTGGSSIGSFSTDLFFESVPDYLLDIKSDKWQWDESTRFIPVVLPRSYLNLYNFGFAQSQGLPQISESMAGQFTLQVVIRGQGKRETFSSRIVGFTDKINTILVPDKFMQWANSQFGEEANPKVSRLIIEVKNPTDPAIAEFIAAKNYDVNDDKGDQGKISYFLKMLVVCVSAVGLLIMLLAAALMVLSINLLVYKNQKTFENLMLLGYSQFQLAKPYYLLTIGINACVFLVSAGVMLVLRQAYMSQLKVLKLSANTADTFIVLGVGLLFVVLVTCFNCLWINRKVKTIQIPKQR